MLMNLKNRTLSTKIEYYQEIWNIKKKKKKLTTFRNIVSILKINSINFIYLFIYLFLFLYVGLQGFVEVAN